MLKTILHQIKNQKRQNTWIFIELIAVGVFLWLVIDPLFVLTANRLIPAGYEQNGLYYAQLGEYNPTHPAFRKEANADSIRKNNYFHQLAILRRLPEVESYCIASVNSIPGSGSWSGGQLFTDTAKVKKDDYVHIQQFETVKYEGSDFFGTYRLRDAHTGEVMKPDADVRKLYISAYCAQRLFGTTDAVGKTVIDGGETVTIGGVFADVKYADYEQPYPMLVRISPEMNKEVGFWKWRYCFLFRLKDGVDVEAFKQRFQAEVEPALSIGNAYCKGFTSVEELSRQFVRNSGVANKLRLQYALTGFALFCIFLGMLGTFWIRAKARRQEIGLMRSMGASGGRIICQFLVESWLLVTLAFVPAVLILLNYVWANGMVTGVDFVMGHNSKAELLNPAYWQNQSVTHFVFVTLLSYFLLLLTALVGTAIPVNRAVETLPAEALRDE